VTDSSNGDHVNARGGGGGVGGASGAEANGLSGTPIPHRLFGRDELLELVEVDASEAQVRQTARAAGLARRTAERRGRMAEDRAMLAELGEIPAGAGFFDRAFEAAASVRERDELLGLGDGTLTREEMRESAVVPYRPGVLARLWSDARVRASWGFVRQHKIVSTAAMVLLSLGGLTLYLTIAFMQDVGPAGRLGALPGYAAGPGVGAGVGPGSESGPGAGSDGDPGSGSSDMLAVGRDGERAGGRLGLDGPGTDLAGDPAPQTAVAGAAGSGSDPGADADESLAEPGRLLALSRVDGLIEAYAIASEGRLVMRARPVAGSGDVRAGEAVAAIEASASSLRTWSLMGRADEALSSAVVPGYRVSVLGLNADGSMIVPALTGEGAERPRPLEVVGDADPDVWVVSISGRASSLAGLRAAFRDAGFEVEFVAADRAVPVGWIEPEAGDEGGEGEKGEGGDAVDGDVQDDSKPDGGGDGEAGEGEGEGADRADAERAGPRVVIVVESSR